MGELIFNTRESYKYYGISRSLNKHEASQSKFHVSQQRAAQNRFKNINACIERNRRFSDRVIVEGKVNTFTVSEKRNHKANNKSHTNGKRGGWPLPVF
jgi:hypothetical protein